MNAKTCEDLAEAKSLSIRKAKDSHHIFFLRVTPCPFSTLARIARMGFIRSTAAVYGAILLTLQHGAYAETICSATDSKTLGPDVRNPEVDGECLDENCTSDRVQVKLEKTE